MNVYSQLYVQRTQLDLGFLTLKCKQITHKAGKQAESDSVVLGWSPRVCISNKLLLDAAAAGWCLDSLLSSETLGNINFPN